MHPVTVLIVDDELEFLDLISKRLQRRNVCVLCASSGQEALETLKGSHVDAVVLDVKMPGMDGITTLEHIKDAYPELPVIMLTGHADMRVAQKGMEKGAADYILKPTTIGDLMVKIREVCIARLVNAAPL